MWIEAENKWVPALKKEELLDELRGPVLPAVARYLPAARGPSHLDGLLGTLKLVDEARFQELQRWVKDLFPGLELRRFDEGTRRPLPRGLLVDL